MTQFIGPAFTENGPVLVEAMVGKGWPNHRHRQRTMIVVDDFGNAVMFRRRCTRCLRWKPLAFDVFAVCKSGKALGMQSTCMACQATYKELRRRRDPEPMKRMAREAERRRVKDPAYRARIAAQALASRERRKAEDPERWYAKQRENSLRYHRAVMADPKRRARYLEDQRIRYRLRKEREGRELASIRPMRPRGAHFPDMVRVFLPAAPLVPFIRRAVDAAVESEETAVEALSLPSRQWFRWKTGAVPNIRLDVAERALLALGLNWFDVWTDEGFEEARMAFEGEEAA